MEWPSGVLAMVVSLRSCCKSLLPDEDSPMPEKAEVSCERRASILRDTAIVDAMVDYKVQRIIRSRKMLFVVFLRSWTMGGRGEASSIDAVSLQ